MGVLKLEDSIVSSRRRIIDVASDDAADVAAARTCLGFDIWN